MRLRLSGLDRVMTMLDRAGNLPQEVDALRHDFASGVHGNIVRMTPVKTGFLRSANVPPMMRGDEVAFVNYAEYARYVELGTGRRGATGYKQYLPDEVSIAYALGRAGTKAQPFMREPIAEGLKELDARLKNLMRKIG